MYNQAKYKCQAQYCPKQQLGQKSRSDSAIDKTKDSNGEGKYEASGWIGTRQDMAD